MKNRILKEGLTFDDVLLIPAYSRVLPSQVDITTAFSRNIKLGIPLVSAAMDTVSESKMAIAMAQLGGIAILHKNMSVEKQAREVRKVKRSHAGMVVDPITMKEDNRIYEALELVREKGISGLLIVDDQHRLKGIITSRDMRFLKSKNQKIKELMTKEPLITVKENYSMEEAKRLLDINKIEKLPVVDRSNRLRGLITLQDILRSEQYPDASKDRSGRLIVGAAVGTAPETIERIEALVAEKVDVLVLDTSHAHSQKVLQMAKKIKKDYPEVDLVVGNIVTARAARELIRLNVDGIKVGIGPGSICTTRIISGAGMPQITAIMEVAEEVGDQIPIIADGGIKYSGDITKALAAGAHSVMLGSLLAGTDESPGEMIIYHGRSFKKYRGMGSIPAMKEGSKDRYFQEDVDLESKLVPEGIEGRVPYRGSIMDLVPLMLGGLRAGMGLTGSRSIPELQKNTRFVKVTPASLKESHAHDVIITEESPNYRLD